MRQQVTVFVLCVLGLLMMFPALSQESAPAHTQSAVQIAGQVVWVKGTVRAIYPEQPPRVLARGAYIYNKDTLSTDMTSSGEVAFTDNTLLALRPGSTFIIENYHFDQAKPETGSSFMTLIEGGFRTITGFIAKARPENYQVKTPYAAIGVRGTTFQVNCQSSRCVVGLEKGAGIAVTNEGGTVVLTPQSPYAVVTAPNVTPTLANQEPALLARPPNVIPAQIPLQTPSPGAKTSGGNCGILIN